MQFESFDAFLEMGGYGTYVWMAFGLSFLALLLLVVLTMTDKRKLFTLAQHEYERQQRIKAVREAKRQQVSQTESSNLQTPEQEVTR